MGIRDIRRKANRDLHDKMKVAAYYYPSGFNPNGFVPGTIYIRAHTNVVDAGDQAGTSLGFAQIREDTPKVIFDLLEAPAPARLDIVMISADEGYRVDHADPKSGEFQNTMVVRLNTAELAGYDSP